MQPYRYITLTVLAALFLLNTAVNAADDTNSVSHLKKLSLEELFSQEVTSATGTSRKLTKTAAAIDVITSEDINRSGFQSIPEALRLATGVEVAQFNSPSWAIGIRGFNTTTSNKIETRMDGRSLYSPLFSGVFWDAQDYVVQDIDRIEVIRGPGATLWGANAMNGVINIITKSAKDTQGGLFSAGYGTEIMGLTSERYGGKIGDSTYYRVYGKYFHRDDFVLHSGAGAEDDWEKGQGGFRIDSDVTGDNLLTFQGDLYYITEGARINGDNEVNGGNLLTRLKHDFNPDSNLQFQFYYDKTKREIIKTFNEDRDTYDLDIRHNLVEGDHNFLYGIGYHLAEDDISRTPVLNFTPDSRSLETPSAFIQDDISIIDDVLSFLIGSKFSHDDYSGFEVQPSARLSYSPTDNQTIWSSISRAVRVPSRIDTDFQIFNTATGAQLFRGNPDFDSEKMIAYELGYRIQPTKELSFDLATFYNDYDELRSLEPQSSGTALVTGNRLEGDTYGFDLTTTYYVTDWLKLKFGYTRLEKDIYRKPGGQDPNLGSGEGNDPENWFTFRSSFDLPHDMQADLIVRYVDDLPAPAVPGYVTMDARWGWNVTPQVELSLVGRNLVDDHHPEFGAQSATSEEVQRSIYGQVTIRF